MFSKKWKLYTTFYFKTNLTPLKFSLKDYNPPYFVGGLTPTPTPVMTSSKIEKNVNDPIRSKMEFTGKKFFYIQKIVYTWDLWKFLKNLLKNVKYDNIWRICALAYHLAYHSETPCRRSVIESVSGLMWSNVVSKVCSITWSQIGT